MQLNNKKIINAWCMYDWANSVYSLVITTAIFPLYYNLFTIKDTFGKVDFFGLKVIDTVLYSYALSFSFLIIAIIIPFLSGIADYTGKKKYFMKGFVYIGSISCMSLFFYDGSQVELAILASIIASIGFSGSLVFYDAFLPEIATPDKHDQVSAKGYSFGYFGSVLLLVFNLFMIKNYQLFGLGNEKEAMQFSFLMVGIWWIAFSQITFYVLKEDSKIINQSESLIYDGYKELKKVFIKFSSLSQIRIFLLSYFFYNTGVQTVILLAATFASKVIGMEGGSLIVLILIIQVVAIIGAYFFAWLSKRIGNKSVLLIMITLWAGVCIAAYYTHSEFQFQIVAGIVGFVMGGIQSLSRATFSKLIPVEETDHASYFSFYNVIYYISIVMGTFSYGLIEQITNNMRYNALLLAVWFVIGFIILLKMKFDFLKKSLN